MKKRPFHQKLIIWLTWTLGGISALGVFLDAISNAIALVNLRVALLSTILIAIGWGIVEVRLSRSPIPWVIQGKEYKIPKLGGQIRLGIVGMILLIWVPPAMNMYNIVFSEELPLTPPPGRTPTPTEPITSILFEEDFEDGKANEFLIKDGDWQVVDDASNKVFAVSNDANLIWVEAKFGSTDWKNYIIEYKAKIIDFDETNQWPVVAVGFREDGKNAYRFLFNLIYGQLQLVYDEGEPWAWVDGFDFNFERRVWYQVRIEADGSHLKMYVDDVIRIDTQDSRLESGYLTLIVGPHTTAQFDDIRVLALDE